MRRPHPTKAADRLPHATGLCFVTSLPPSRHYIVVYKGNEGRDRTVARPRPCSLCITLSHHYPKYSTSGGGQSSISHSPRSRQRHELPGHAAANLPHQFAGDRPRNQPPERLSRREGAPLTGHPTTTIARPIPYRSWYTKAPIREVLCQTNETASRPGAATEGPAVTTAGSPVRRHRPVGDGDAPPIAGQKVQAPETAITERSVSPLTMRSKACGV